MSEFFENGFENDVGELMSSAFDRAEFKLEKHSPKYKKKMKRWLDLHEELSDILNGETPDTDTDYRKLLREYLDIGYETRQMEQYSLYLQAFSDCMTLLKMCG